MKFLGKKTRSVYLFQLFIQIVESRLFFKYLFVYHSNALVQLLLLNPVDNSLILPSIFYK